MNETAHTFWYRPLWQQILFICLIIFLCIIGYYFSYWDDREQQRVQFEKENKLLMGSIHQNKQFIHQSPSLSQLNEKISELSLNAELNHDPFIFIAQLQTLIIQSNITLNQLRPHHSAAEYNHTYQLDIQGSYNDIFQFIQSVTLQYAGRLWLFSEINIKPKEHKLTATLSISFLNNNAFIKDENSDED
ncbi:hypothetical protein C9446_00520 [Providencia heimbachae]|uniref:hypothetical protein n=1 Tax=Providencia heimbachae TaxID=333962 RepID=UPI0010BED51A|nr:hypothetical protein [Providencia heimbachae]QCJ68484.1 hypothetical protein C9446_00520 [Providencia heimbachae]